MRSRLVRRRWPLRLRASLQQISPDKPQATIDGRKEQQAIVNDPITEPTIETALREKAARQQQHQTNEQIFWTRQIRAARGLNWVTLVGALVGIAGLYFIWASLNVAVTAAKDSRIAADAARDQAAAAIAGQRPWVTVIPKIEGDFEFVRDQDRNVIARVPLYFDMRNIGRTPAIAARVVAKPIVYSDHILEDQEILCNQALEKAGIETDSPLRTVWHTTIFPDETGYALIDPLLISSDELKWYSKFVSGLHYPNRLLPDVIGCAIYRVGLEGKERWHQSRFIYRVYGSRRDINPDGNSVRATGLGVIRGDARGFYAD
jgi:hypothetical protein